MVRDRPLSYKERAKLKGRSPLKKISVDPEVIIKSFLPVAGPMGLSSIEGNINLSEIRLTIDKSKIGKHIFGPDISQELVPSVSDVDEVKGKEKELTSYLPDHLHLETKPPKPPVRVKTLTRMISTLNGESEIQDGKGLAAVVGIMPPKDDRQVLFSTAYPWCTVGRVTASDGTFGSGVMVGPRHMLTASHCIPWRLDGSVGSITFSPAHFGGVHPFGVAHGIKIYYKQKIFGEQIGFNDTTRDYAVVVLNNSIGNLTGWMGGKIYSDGWDGQAYWDHVGYPIDFGGSTPIYQRAIKLDGAVWDTQAQQYISTPNGDGCYGQSGGPLFAWFPAENGPRTVSVLSSINTTFNSTAGGADMVDLIWKARNQFP